MTRRRVPVDYCPRCDAISPGEGAVSREPTDALVYCGTHMPDIGGPDDRRVLQLLAETPHRLEHEGQVLKRACDALHRGVYEPV